MGQKYMHTVPHTAMPAMQPRFDCGHTGHEMLCGFGLNNPLRCADPSGWQSQPVITLPGGLSFYTLEGYHAYLRSLGHETPAFAGSYRYDPFQNGFGPGQFSGSGSLYAYDDYSTYDVVSNTFGNERWNGSFAGQVQSAYSNQQPNTYAQYEVNNDGSLNKTFETSMDNIQIVSSQNNINIYYTPLIAGNGPSGGSVLLSSHPAPQGGRGMTYGNDFARELQNHYENGNGTDYHLSKERLYDIYNKAVINGSFEWNKAKSMGNNIYQVPTNLYKTDYALSFGRATMYIYNDFSGKIYPTGFYDTWDLDPKPWGTRSIPAELITRYYNWSLTGTNFKVTYP